MVRILFLLIAILVANPKIVTAQSVSSVEQSSCDRVLSQYLEGSATSEEKSDRQIPNTTNNNQSANSPSSKTTDHNIISNNAEKPSNTEPKIAVAGISVPSLWWAKEQFDPFGGRLIDDWLTYPRIKQIDLTVNWQLWTLLDYLGRYRFINQFGTVAREYGYSLRVFNQQQQCLALYEYNGAANPPKWEIKIEGLGQDSLPVEPENSL